MKSLVQVILEKTNHTLWYDEEFRLELLSTVEK